MCIRDRYKPTNKDEAGVPNEILTYMANLVKRENSVLPRKMEIMLSTKFDSARSHLYHDTDAMPRSFNAEGLDIVNKILELS